MKIRILGQSNNCGGGIHYRNFLNEFRKIYLLNKSVEQVDLTNKIEVLKASKSSNVNDINIWFWQDPQIELFKGANIVWAIFESNVLPRAYIDFLKDKLIWTPSHWAKQILVKHKIQADRIDVIPEGVDHSQFHPYIRETRSNLPSPLKILMHGKFETRKGYDVLFDAYNELSKKTPNCYRLLLKADFFADEYFHHQKLLEEVSNRKLQDIKIYKGNWEAEHIIGLYHFSDVFVYPSRAEAWGLSLIEALACGLPTLTTYYSGHTEYLKDVKDLVTIVDHEEEPNNCELYEKYWGKADTLMGNGSWAKADTKSLTEKIIKLKNNYAEMSEKALVASLIIRNNFSWQKSIEKAINALKERNLLRLKYSIQG
jgi:glycosyltransferase involved in cell wall biosynthesis